MLQNRHFITPVSLEELSFSTPYQHKVTPLEDWEAQLQGPIVRHL